MTTPNTDLTKLGEITDSGLRFEIVMNLASQSPKVNQYELSIEKSEVELNFMKPVDGTEHDFITWGYYGGKRFDTGAHVITSGIVLATEEITHFTSDDQPLDPNFYLPDSPDPTNQPDTYKFYEWVKVRLRYRTALVEGA